ncbi:MAG: hypothetical protein P1V19_24175 [Gimesia sp.]|nr:hypothetical protein [Gimesia sp.]
MKRRSGYSLFTIFFSLLCGATLQAGIDIELTNGDRIRADHIEWGTSSSLIVESAIEGTVTQRMISLSTIKGLSIGENHYDQKTLQFAASHRTLIQPTEYISTHKKKRYARTYPEVEVEPSTPSPPTNVSAYQCESHSRKRSVIIGIHDDPLSAYGALLHQYYPNGVPTLERGYALGLMRAKAAERALNVLPRPPALPPQEELPPSQVLPPPPGQAPVSGKLTQISLQATPVNAEGKADWNALSIRLKGFDSLGNPARISGNVRISLYGQRQLLLHVWDQQFAAKPLRTISLAQWTARCSSTPETQTARAGNLFGAGQAYDQTWIVKLPPRIPEHNPNIYALGEVQVTLAAPGKGTFQASASAVPLKHVSLNRDLSLANFGTRMFPSETTSEGISRMSRLNLNAPSRPYSRTLSIQP